MKTLAMILAVAGMVLGGVTVLSGQTTIYVDPSGDDATGNGSAANPYKTVQKGVDMAVAGNTVHANAGTYREWVIVDKGIIIEGAGADSTTLRGWSRYESQQEYNDHRSDLNYWSTGWYGCITVNSDNVEIRNMRIEEASTWGIHADGVANLKIHDNKFDWFGQSSIRVLDVDGAEIYDNEAFRSTRQRWYDPPGVEPGSMVDSTRGGDLVEVWGTTGAATEINNNTAHSGNLPLYVQGADGLNVHDNTFDVRAPTTSSSYNFGFVDTVGMYLSGADNCTFNNNTVTGSGYLSSRVFSTCDNSTFTNNTFNSPIRDEGSVGTTWATSNTWNDGHQSIATTAGQWYRTGDAVIMTQQVAGGSAPVATNLAVTELAAGGTHTGHGWYDRGDTAGLHGEAIQVTSDFSAHTFGAMVKFYYYPASELSDAGYVPSQMRVMWDDPTAGKWKLANATHGAQTYAGGWRGNLLPDLATNLKLGDHGYYDGASYKFIWACVDHYTDFGMLAAGQGDADGDRDVDLQDAGKVITNWTGSDPSPAPDPALTWADGDYDDDNDVDLADAGKVVDNWTGAADGSYSASGTYNYLTGEITVTLTDVEYLSIDGVGLLTGDDPTASWNALISGSALVDDCDDFTGFWAMNNAQTFGPGSIGDAAATGLGAGDLTMTYAGALGTDAITVDLDVIPEPATMCLLGLGGIGLLLRRKCG